MTITPALEADLPRLTAAVRRKALRVAKALPDDWTGTVRFKRYGRHMALDFQGSAHVLTVANFGYEVWVPDEVVSDIGFIVFAAPRISPAKIREYLT